MKKSIVILGLLIGFSVVIFNSCSKSSDTSATPTPTLLPFAGSWQRSVGTGVLSLNIKNDNTYSLLSSGAEIEAGSFLSTTSTITFTANSGSATGCSGKPPGKYNFVLALPVQTFTLASDSCLVRASGVNGQWAKQ